MHTSLLLLSLIPALQEDPSLLTAPLAVAPQVVEFDAPGQANHIVSPRTLDAPGAPSWNAPEAPESLLHSRMGLPPKPVDDATPDISAPLSIRDRMTHVFFSEPGDGRVWARGRDFRASFGVEGFTFLPVFGKAAPREFPVEFTLRQVSVGGAALPLGVDAIQQAEGDVTLTHPSLREVYHLDLDGVEQTFVFESLPASGELVLDLAVGSELSVVEDADGLHFVHPTLGHVSYGDAFVLDATGARVAIPRVWTGDSIELRVPAAFLADAVLPLTVDPRVTAFTSSFGVNDDTRPDICYDGQQNQYWVVWEEYTSATNSDCYVTSFTGTGIQGASFAVEITSDDWTEPKIAYHYGANRLLVVASEDAAGSGSIRGQLINAATDTLVGTEFAISTCCFRKLNPDVGGTNWDSVTNNYFCVVWSFEAAAGNRDVQYRIVNWDGTLVTGVTTVENSSADTIHTTISQSMGDSELFGDWWTIAWTKDTNADGFGNIEARRVVWSGSTTLGAGNFVVDSSTNNAWPTVTSRLDDNLVAVADRPSIVVYESDFASTTGPGGRQRSLYGKVVTDGQAFASNAINFTLEDVDGELDQRHCHIATDGSAWYLVYSELYYNNPSGTDYDVYYTSGHISQTSNNAYLALAERHQNLAFTGSAERYGRVATVWDGESVSTSDDASIVWVRLDGTNGGTLTGYSVDIPTIDTSSNIAVGRQYCDANDNGGAAVMNARSSWMWMEGDQSLFTTHRAYCENVTPNATGYLITSMSTGNVNLAGGSAGRLCVLGGGRYVNAVQNSGTGRTYSTAVNPLSLPTPNGFVSASAGQTWNFQYWHRDSIGGVATSNFSNACQVMFQP
ncbi:MAG: hypothetical protein R3F49_12410 [Planctomycetota bacterium]